MRTIGFILLWLAGSGAAIGVAWSGVAVVDNEIIDPAPAVELRSPAEDNAFPTLGATPLAADDRTPDGETDRADETEVPETQQATTAAQQSSSTSRATTTPTRPTSTPGQSASTPSPTQPPTSTATSTTAPPTTVATGQTLTFNLIGGSTAISFSPSGVQVLWASPKPGFEVKIESEPPGMKVEFRADNHRSRVDAWWSGGPQHSVREEAD